jgi:hypothetical protein
MISREAYELAEIGAIASNLAATEHHELMMEIYQLFLGATSNVRQQ